MGAQQSDRSWPKAERTLWELERGLLAATSALLAEFARKSARAE
jgi:hypothetical protein